MNSTTRLFLLAIGSGIAIANAGVVQPTATLPPTAGQYDLPLVCLPMICLVNANISGFNTTSDTFSGGNEFVVTTANFGAQVFQNAGGSPGVFINPLSAPGTASFEYVGRTSPTEVGTFASQITSFDFVGSFVALDGSHNFEIRSNAASPTLGTTSVTGPDSENGFQISSFFDVFAELRIDNGPFVAGPGRPTTLDEAPEPGTLALVFAGVLGIAGLRRKIA